jgi:hypothetical protein
MQKSHPKLEYVVAHTILISDLIVGGEEWSASRLRRFSFGVHCIRESVDPIAGLDTAL